MKRDKSIDFLMFWAVLLVVNSHLEGMYVVPFKPLATGGIIGDALFFFCSGYKLFLGHFDRFDNWYKRRVVRIYPSLLIWNIFVAAVFSLPLTVTSLFNGFGSGYWFIKCIMLHYIALYFIRKYFAKHLGLVLALVCSGIVIWWWLAYSPKFAIAMLGSSKFEWYYLFAFTLLGGIFAGRWRPEITFGRALALVGLAFVIHYGWLVLVEHCSVLMPVRFLLLLPLAAIISSLYCLSKTSVVCRLMESKWWGGGVTALGGLCLEVYISHGVFETDRYNGLFPLNIIGYFIVVFLGAYLIRCLTRFALQVMNKNQEFDYHEIFKL